MYENILKIGAVNLNFFTHQDIAKIVAEQPAPRFYISPKFASMCVMGYYHGTPKYLRKNREMVKDLVENYEMLRNKHPHTPKDIIWEMLVNCPSKRFYVADDVARGIIFNYKKYDDKQRN